MKTNHGNILSIITIFFVTFLQADDFIYNLSLSNDKPFFKEGIILDATFQQTNPNVVMMFDFKVVKSNDYEFKRINASENELYHDTKAVYRYLIHPLKTGKININFNLIKKITTDASVAYSFSGDRDNVKGLFTTDTKIKLPPLKLMVKQVPKDTLIVGDFTLHYNINTKEALAYEPIPFKVEISGIGYPPLFDKFPLKNNDINIFMDTPNIKTSIVNNSIQSTVVYPLAISNDKSFNLHKISIKAFNPKTQESYFLTIPTTVFHIKEIKTSELIDDINYPKQETNHFKNFILFLVVFCSGFISGYIFNKKSQKGSRSKVNIKKQQTYNCRTKKALHHLLLSRRSEKYKEMIDKCEKSLYKPRK